MTRENIICMALEAEFKESEIALMGDNFIRFAALIAAAERERLATKFMKIHNAQQHRNNYFAFAARVIREEV